MLHDAQNILAVSYNFEQILVTDKVEARERCTFALKVLSERFLYLVKEVGKAFEALLDTGNVHDIDDKWRFVDLLHDSQKLGIDVLEPSAFNGEEMLDIGTAREDTLQVHPLPLDIDPDICSRLTSEGAWP